jgi:flagella basal body P-ring formation protein FlgA
MLFRLFLLAGACAVTCFASAAPLTIELRSSVLIGHARIALADVALVRAQPLAATLDKLELAPAPRIGYVERLTRAQIERAIRRQPGVDGAPIAWSGADSVSVSTQSQPVAGAKLAAAAVAAVRQQYSGSGASLAVAPLAQPSDLEVPAGRLELRARPVAAAALAARTPLWVDLVVDGAVYRSVVVPLAVTLRRAAYVANHAIERGAWVSLADFDVADASVAGIDALPVQGDLEPFRVREALKAGQTLATGAVNASGKVLRGDQVRLFVSAGQIGIETAAIAMADGGPGQMISVRPLGANDNITGRVGQSGTVTIE